MTTATATTPETHTPQPAGPEAGAPIRALHTEFRDPADLQPHPKVKHLLGRWAKDSEEAQAMRRSIIEHSLPMA